MFGCGKPMELTNYISVGIPIFLIGVLAFFARILEGNWFAPGSFFSLYWFVFTLVPVIAAPDYPVQAWGLYWIFFFLFSCCGWQLDWPFWIQKAKSA